MKTCIDEFINYDDEPENPFSTLAKALKNIPKMFPKVKAKRWKRRGMADSLIISSDDEAQLKQAYINLVFADGDEEYEKMCNDGTLEAELEGCGFYDWDDELS